MAIDHRHHDRVPIITPVSYVLDRAGCRNGHGTATNLSVRGLKITGNVLLHAGEVCSMEVRLPSRKWVSILVGVVRWTRGEEAGIEALVMNDEATKQLNEYIQQRVRVL